METEQQERVELQSRKLLLDFYSSELTTHSRLIIGFAVILLAILEITQNIRALGTLSLGQYLIAFFGIFTAAFALWFLLMRHLTYGILTEAATHAHPLRNQPGNYLDRLKPGVNQYAMGKRILGVIPPCLFYSIGEKIHWLQKRIGVKSARVLGLLLCGFPAFIMTYLVMKLIG